MQESRRLLQNGKAMNALGGKKKTGWLQIRQFSELVFILVERLQSMATGEEAAFIEEYPEG